MSTIEVEIQNIETIKIHTGAPPEWAPASDIRLSQNSVWTEENFFKAMREGISPVTGNQIGMPMPIALTKQMNDVELKALWLYLKTK